MRSKESFHEDHVQVLKFCLFPSPFPVRWYSLAVSVQKSINIMIHRVAHDNQFLAEAYKDIVTIDEFSRNLYDIHLKVLRDPKAQSTCLGHFRSDYMLNQDPEILRQIEVNTVAASFAGQSTLLDQLHTYLSRKYPFMVLSEKKSHCSESLRGLALGLVEAWEHYGVADAIILFVISDKETNLCDQKVVELEIMSIQSKANVKRRRLNSLNEHITLDEDNILRLDDQEVAVVYYRTAYVPKNYGSQSAWDARLKLERSRAIKCPPIKYQLAGAKKIQQLLTKKDILKKYVSTSEGLDEIYSTFGAMYPLSRDEEGDQAIDMALRSPEKYVLKPQREGGGNNFFGEDLTDKLLQIKNSEERNAYVLMELVKPVHILNHYITSDKKLKERRYVKDEMSLELGIYGVILANEKKIIHNREAGSLLRSKVYTDKESGITSGSGFIDDIFLY